MRNSAYAKMVLILMVTIVLALMPQTLLAQFAPSTLQVTKVVDWSGTAPDISQVFEICISGPSYPAGTCFYVDDGTTITMIDLLPGDYSVTETDPGPEWQVSGSGQTLSVVSGQNTSTTITNTRQSQDPEPELWAVEYRWGDPTPGYSLVSWPLFEGWMNVRIENRGAGEAFNVTADLMSWPANTTVPDPSVIVGDIPVGGSAWSADTFTTVVNMASPVDVCDQVYWRFEYDDAKGIHHVVESVPEFPPGEGPCDGPG
jgi:hypothetical protein